MENLRITTVQATLHWENVAANLQAFAQKLDPLLGRTDLVLLPEMFTTGFSMQPAAVTPALADQTLEWMQGQAQKLQAVVAGSVIAPRGETYVNRMLWVRPDGQVQHYDKRHLFTLAKEHLHYQAGTEKVVLEWRGWKICPQICYDLRFPVWSRNTEGYDLLFYVANWPAKRRYHWQQLLLARAIENQCYVAGVNRVGTDENGHEYSGDSTVIDFSGQPIYQVSGVEDVFTATLSRKGLGDYRSRLAFLNDQDKFKILP